MLGLSTRKGIVEPPTVSGHRLAGPDQIELGQTRLVQLGKQVGATVVVGTGPSARRMRIVGTVTWPSIGLQLAEPVSPGRGATLPGRTPLAVERLNIGGPQDESLSALSSPLAIDLDPGTRPGPVVDRMVAADPENQPEGTYQVDRVLGAAVVNDAQMEPALDPGRGHGGRRPGLPVATC
jgi:hypothetical protein